jgi:hypothetical protein
MRMVAADIERLYKEAGNGTYVEVVYEPISAALDDSGRVWLEVHPDVYGGKEPDPARVHASLLAAGLGGLVDWDRVDKVVKRRWGTAEDVTRRDVPTRGPVNELPSDMVEASLPARYMVTRTP